MYKSMQFLYVGKKLHFGNASFLASKMISANSTLLKLMLKKNSHLRSRGMEPVYRRRSIYSEPLSENLALHLAPFIREENIAKELHWMNIFSPLQLCMQLEENLAIGPGVDITSGNNGSDPTKRFQRFDPLYGTPHKFWGYMDYFYVADGFGPNGLSTTI